MSILKIARMGHPVLRARARALEPAEIATPRVQQLIEDMIATMREYQGVGLAAPQVHELVRVFVAAIETDEREAGHEGPPALVIINPEIRPVGSGTIDDWEGCLSIPDLRGRVQRAAEIQVLGLDRHGERISLRATEFAARVIPRGRPSRRDPVRRSDDVARDADVPRGILAVLVEAGDAAGVAVQSFLLTTNRKSARLL